MWCGKHPYGSAMGICSGYPRYPANVPKRIPKGYWVVGKSKGETEGGFHNGMTKTL
jgi:hypothetical protein